MNNHLISLTVFFPVVGALLHAVLPTQRNRWIALASSVAASICAVILVVSMQPATAEPQATELFPWVGSYSISYHMAVDGLSALLVLLIAILFPILIAAEWNQKTGLRGMHSLFLILQTSLFGAVCAQDLFLQFFFWGLSALPIYFLVGIWGGKGREQAAFRSMVTSSLGDALIFAALIFIYYSVEPHSFSLKDLSGGRLVGKTFEFLGYPVQASTLAFALIGTGLSLRTPIWPLHGWFVQVAEEAPFSVFVALSAGIVPVAMYILMRVSYQLFPETLNTAGTLIIGVGMVNLIMGGLCAASQRGLRRLLAYLSVSEVGLILLGIGSLSSTGMVGAVYQQMMLGLSLAGFGLFAGVISERTGHSYFLDQNGERKIGGVATVAPGVTVVASIVIASILGFPGLGGFVGHALVIIGSFSIHPFTIVVTGGAIVLSSYYLFFMYRNVFLGSPSPEIGHFADLTLRERAFMLPLVAGLLLFGLYPKPFIELIKPTVLTLLSAVK